MYKVIEITIPKEAGYTMRKGDKLTIRIAVGELKISAINGTKETDSKNVTISKGGKLGIEGQQSTP